MQITLTFLAALILCGTALTGCGKNKETTISTSQQVDSNQPGDAADALAAIPDMTDIILSGKYIATSTDSTEGMSFFEMADFTLESVYIDFREDGKLTFYILDNGIEGTYSGSGNTGTITLENDDESETTEFTLDGSKVIMSDSHGGAMVFEKE